MAYSIQVNLNNKAIVFVYSFFYLKNSEFFSEKWYNEEVI
ncbi:hypothetical protein HMPREF9395_0877 [Streptococcus sanguinis SK1058]|nr:hypothetical protein HMPREF9395_0877 [Streptococcus sanguinis SK1058]